MTLKSIKKDNKKNNFDIEDLHLLEKQNIPVENVIAKADSQQTSSAFVYLKSSVRFKPPL